MKLRRTVDYFQKQLTRRSYLNGPNKRTRILILSSQKYFFKNHTQKEVTFFKSLKKRQSIEAPLN